MQGNRVTRDFHVNIWSKYQEKKGQNKHNDKTRPISQIKTTGVGPILAAYQCCLRALNNPPSKYTVNLYILQN
jgi:hypothetical protein